MDRLEGYFDEAMTKLTILSGHLKLPCLFEKIKIYLACGNYQGLINFLNNQLQGELKHPVIQEALAIAYANTGKFFKAIDHLAWARARDNSFAQQVFFLRECEIHVSLRKNIFHQMSLLYAQVVTLLNKQPLSQHIKFGLQAAALLSKANFKEEAAQITYYCLKAAEMSCHELLKADSLILLNELITEHQGKNLIEDLMIKHFHKTQHEVAKKKMLNEFPGLKHVEIDRVDELSSLLFEKLISLPIP